MPISNLRQLTPDEVQSRVLNPETHKYDYYIDARNQRIVCPGRSEAGLGIGRSLPTA